MAQRRNQNQSKKFLCYCPLTPKIALFSSPLLKNPSEQKYQCWETDYLQFVFSMNFLTHISSESIVISDKPNPYGIYKNNIKKYLEAENLAQQIQGKQILFYTSNSRYWLNVEDYERISDNPIKSKIKFWTSDFKTLKSIAEDEFIETVHFYDNGLERGFTRGLVFHNVSLHKEEPSIMTQV